VKMVFVHLASATAPSFSLRVQVSVQATRLISYVFVLFLFLYCCLFDGCFSLCCLPLFSPLLVLHLTPIPSTQYADRLGIEQGHSPPSDDRCCQLAKVEPQAVPSRVCLSEQGAFSARYVPHLWLQPIATVPHPPACSHCLLIPPPHSTNNIKPYVKKDP